MACTRLLAFANLIDLHVGWAFGADGVMRGSQGDVIVAEFFSTHVERRAGESGP